MTLRRDAAPAIEMTQRDEGRLGQSIAFSSRDVPAWRSEYAVEGWSATLLSLEASQGRKQPIAAMVRETADRRRTFAVLWCAASGAAELERLHAFLLGWPAETEVDLKDGCGVLGQASAPVVRGAVADLLRRVAEARIARAVTARVDGPDWRLVDVAVPLDGDRPLDAAARVSHAGTPIEGAGVSFWREPHMACSTLTDADGVARCTLQDTHGHAPHEAGPTAPPTLVTFSGRLLRDALFVPAVAVVATPPATRCLSTVVPAEVAAAWDPGCRGFASRTWALPVGASR
jgi:hypothetical protein